MTDIDEQLEPSGLTRRGFVRVAAVSAAALSAGGAASLSPSRARAAPPPKGGTRYPLYIPPAVAPGTQTLTLTEAPANVNIGGGSSNVWAYSATLPTGSTGPTFPGASIVTTKGEVLAVTLVNGLSEETITHGHGMIVGEANDGGVWYAIPPSATYDYRFTINQRAALNFYHPHPHMLTGKQVNLGLAGAFIVRDEWDTGAGAHGLPYGYGGREVPLVIRDATLDSAGNLLYKPRSGGFDGQIPLVNGTRSPYLAVDEGVYRFRVLNGANARIFGLALSNGAPFSLIGNDGGLLSTQTELARIDISPAERLDLLLSFKGLGGQSVMLRDLRAGWDLLEFRVTAGNAADVPAVELPSIDPLSGPAIPTRTFSFDGMSKINGKLFDHNRIDFEVPFGVTERWRFITSGNAPHPVHVHGASFQVKSRTGGRRQLYPWELGWKDTVLLEDRETVDVLIRFDAEVNRGSRYLIHCHKLEHEDMGMMSAFQVV
ncbi:MAG TPA: multicopper oxidase domain-containing protein [Gaiellaceae bacterium]|nr:multicopper oxidase domain-containing protein [Gaiellaceae bacterium]